MQAGQPIVIDSKIPGGINSPYGLILFDGVCVLCSRGCRFVSKRDRRRYFRFIPMGWQWMWVFHFIPPKFRDTIYDWVARNRYRWFGQRDTCMLPNLDRSWPS